MNMTSIRSYQDIQPHHILVLYVFFQGLKTTKSYRKMSDKFVQLISKGSDYIIPLIYYHIIPDFLIRYGIR